MDIKQELQYLLDLLREVKNVSLGNALFMLQDTQKTVSKPVMGCIPDEGELPTKDAIRTYTLSMIVETTELLQTLDWKPWKSKNALDRRKIIDEFADILAFLGILVHYLGLYGISPEELSNGYTLKTIENIERFLGNRAPEYKQQSLFETEE